MHLHLSGLRPGKLAIAFFAVFLAEHLGQPGCIAAAPDGKRYALLVGVKDYDHSKLTSLKWTENDVTELEKVLHGAGYEVTRLSDSQPRTEGKPTRANLLTQLQSVLDRCRRQDIVLVALAGHGIQFEAQKDSYYCPQDAHPSRPETMVSLKLLYEQLDACGAGIKFLLVDACRDDPTAGRGSRGIDGDSAPRPPKGLAALFSCSAGQRAFEHDELRHGCFFYHVLQGLRGDAKDSDGEITFDSLSVYVRKRVSRQIPQLVGGGAKQEPNLVADLSGESPVLIGRRVETNTTINPVIPPPPQNIPTRSRAPQWVHALDLRARSGSEQDFSSATRTFGMEAFVDENNGNTVYISETGAIAVLTPPQGIQLQQALRSKAPLWLHGLDLRVRKGGEKEFTQATAHFGLEAFLNENAGDVVYISETGTIAGIRAPLNRPTSRPRGEKEARWLHGLELHARKGGERDITQNTKVLGVEVYGEVDDSYLIYITETNSMAVIPVTPSYTPSSKRAAQWLHGLDLRARKGGEKEITKDTKTYGVEVFRDENNGNIIYISETGAIAVLTPSQGRGVQLGQRTKAPQWLHGLDLRARKGGEKEFTKDTKTFGVEVFRDENNGNLVYITETGSIAVVPAK